MTKESRNCYKRYFNELQMNDYDTRSVPEGEYKTSSHFDFSKSVFKGFWKCRNEEMTFNLLR